MLFWKKFMGHYILDMYSEERFFFLDPQIRNILFSYRKGWLLYTPVMVFSLIGILVAKFRLKEMFWFLSVFTVLNIYVLSCWWDWGYGGSFGCRPIIQSYAILIFPLAASFSWLWGLVEKNKTMNWSIRLVFISVLFLVIKLNLFQSWQYKFGIIHWSGMNKKTYKFIFLNDKLSKEDRAYLDKEVTPPDYSKMLKGERN
jgi:hypothetical protein